MDEAMELRQETPEYNNVELQALEETNGEAPAQEEADEDAPQPTPEQLTFLRYGDVSGRSVWFVGFRLSLRFGLNMELRLPAGRYSDANEGLQESS